MVGRSLTWLTPLRGRTLWDQAARAALTLLAVAVVVLHTREAWVHLHPAMVDWKTLVPSWGPALLSAWGEQTVRIAAAALFALSLPGLGRWFLRRNDGPFSTEIAAGVGLLLWAGIAFCAATAGVAHPNVMRGLSALLVVAGGLGTWRSRRAEGAAAVGEGIHPLEHLTFLLLLAASVVPDIFHDSHVYHLAVPQSILQTGRWTDLADSHLTRLPGLVQMIYVWGLAWSDDRLCKLLNLSVSGWLWFALRRFGQSLSIGGAGAGLMFLTCPLVLIGLWSASSDILSAFFLVAALLLLEQNRSKPSATTLSLLGLFLGAAAATRLTAVCFFPLFALRLPWTRLNRQGLSLLALGVLLPMLPWWIRNALWTGNPFFPLARTLLGGDSPENLSLVAQWAVSDVGSGSFGNRLAGFFVHSVAGAGSGRFSFVGPAFLAFACTGGPWMDRDRDRRLWWLGIGLSYLTLSWFSGVLRYFMPGLALLAIVSSRGHEEAVRSLVRGGRRLHASLLARLLSVVAGINLFWGVLVFTEKYDGWDVVWGRVTAAQYRAVDHPGISPAPSDGAYAFLKDRRAKGRLFSVGDPRIYGSPIPTTASGAFNVPTYARWLREDPNPVNFVDRLRKEGYTYVLVNRVWLARATPEPYRSPSLLAGLSSALDQLGPPIHQDRWCALFQTGPRELPKE